MKHSVWKKALGLMGAVALAAALFAGASSVKADETKDEGVDKSTTSVVLTKYAATGLAENGSDIKEHKLDQTPEGFIGSYKEGQITGTVKGAMYNVYDITAAYWEENKGTDNGKNPTVSDVDPAVYAKELTNPIKTAVTNEKGQATIVLPNAQNGKPAVYLFKENDKALPSGYKASADFVIGLPGYNEKGEVLKTAYVYPKDEIGDTNQLKFTKVDKYNQDTVLAGAKFKIKNKDGQYAKLGNSEGEVTGFSTEAKDVTWVFEDKATIFVSDDKGEFGFSATPSTKKDDGVHGLDKNALYTVVETAAPKGYQKDLKILKVDDNKVNPQSVAKDEKDESKKKAAGYVGTDSPKGILPHTGGAGIIAIIAAGLAITLIGLVAYNKRRAA